jgi:hypothetical protein
MLLEVLDEEIGRERLSHIRMDVHKPTNDGVCNSDDAEQIPEIHCANSQNCK